MPGITATQKIARKLLGSRKATMKASDIGPAPRIAAIMMSRKNPATRDSAVNPPTDRSRPINDPSPGAPKARMKRAARRPPIESGAGSLPQGERVENVSLWDESFRDYRADCPGRARFPCT